jgi:hypothetical protein
MQNFQKVWQVESQGHIYEADFEELKQWIIEGGVLPTDRVKRGNLRWVAAEKVPELYNFFNSDDFTAAFQTEVGITKSEPINEDFQTQFAFQAASEEATSESGEEKVCFSHRDSEAFFACDVCKRNYCKTCPNSFGGTVKLCPKCGGLCRNINEAVDIKKSIGAMNKPYLKIDKNINDYGKSNRSGLQPATFRELFTCRNPFVLMMVGLLFISILGAAFSIFLMLSSLAQKFIY